MASTIQRKRSYCVVYLYDDEDGSRKQKWETFKTMDEAKRRKAEIEYRQELGSFVVPQCRTLDELMKEYVDLYGKSIWSPSMYSGSTGLIRNYISPAIGSMKLTEITSRVLEKFYMNLLKTKAVPRITDRKGAKVTRYVTPSTVRKIHNLLKSCFHQAVKWDLIEKNPAIYATVPKAEEKRRDMWDGPTLFHAIEVCEDERLKMALNLSFAGSLRLGELLGLTWDCVDVTQESIDRGMASIFITKELQRTSKSTLSQLDAVQGDSGHAQAKMVTDQYSHILDDGRKENARRMEDAFYAGHGSENFGDDNDGSTAPETESADTVAAAGLDAETLTKILNNPELATLLKTLADKL